MSNKHYVNCIHDQYTNNLLVDKDTEDLISLIIAGVIDRIEKFYLDVAMGHSYKLLLT